MAVITVAYHELEAGSPLRIPSSQEDLWTLRLEISGQMLKGKTALCEDRHCIPFL